MPHARNTNMLFTQRNIDIFKAVLEGDSYGTIGRRYDVSRQRIEQLFKRMLKTMPVHYCGITYDGEAAALKLKELNIDKIRANPNKQFYLDEINKKVRRDYKVTHVSIDY